MDANKDSYASILVKEPEFVLVYNEDLTKGHVPPVDREYFSTSEGLDACKMKNRWNIEKYKKYIYGLQPMGKHCFKVRCKGKKEMETFLQYTPVVLMFGDCGREFMGGTGDLNLDPFVVKVKIQDLPTHIPDNFVVEKLAKYGKVEKATEREKVRDGTWKDFETGSRFFYMRDLKDPELGLPPSLFVKRNRVRIFHDGQLRGQRRWKVDLERKGEAEDQVKSKAREKNRVDLLERAREEWRQQRDGDDGELDDVGEVDDAMVDDNDDQNGQDKDEWKDGNDISGVPMKLPPVDNRGVAGSNPSDHQSPAMSTGSPLSDIEGLPQDHYLVKNARWLRRYKGYRTGERTIEWEHLENLQPALDAEQKRIAEAKRQQEELEAQRKKCRDIIEQIRQDREEKDHRRMIEEQDRRARQSAADKTKSVKPSVAAAETAESTCSPQNEHDANKTSGSLPVAKTHNDKPTESHPSRPRPSTEKENQFDQRNGKLSSQGSVNVNEKNGKAESDKGPGVGSSTDNAAPSTPHPEGHKAPRKVSSTPGTQVTNGKEDKGEAEEKRGTKRAMNARSPCEIDGNSKKKTNACLENDASAKSESESGGENDKQNVSI